LPYTDKLTPKTVNKHLSLISSLLDWASGQGHCTANHALRLKIKVKATDPREARDPWSDEELKVLFSPEHYPLHGESHMFWLPILGILTGARLDELSQLRPQDVRNEEGLWYIDINDTGDKTVKTIWSVRKVPLHPLLANTLKFQEFANRREKEGDTHLFPELFGFASDSRKIASSHFSKFKLRVLKIDNPKISFHSLRHTVKQSLSKLKVAPVTRNDLQGWQNEGVPDGTYGMRTPLQTLYDDAVARLPLAFDYSFLASSKWVTGELVKTTGKPRKKRMKWKG
jgi:integrase